MEIQEWLGDDNELGKDILLNKYLHENESFDDWINRISNGNEQLKTIILQRKFLFGGRILAYRGLPDLNKKVTYSNCFVQPPVEDSLESIFDTAKQMALTYSRGGGCGLDISKLSPKGSKINNAADETSGAVSFMDLYDLTTRLIGMHGRRGALLISMSCEHPDIEEFMECKNDLSKITKANISIRVTDDFMNAVKNDTSFLLHYTRAETGEIIEKMIDARELFLKMAKMNWEQAEPGVLMWNTIEEYNLMSENHDFKYAGVNPCGEEPLPPWGSCLLGSLNLSEFVQNAFEENSYFDKDDFIKSARIATRALNDVLDEGIEFLPLPQQQETAIKWKQIGLGITGLHDMLLKLGVDYGSKDAVNLCDYIGSLLIEASFKESINIAKERGSFEGLNKEEVLKSKFFLNNLNNPDIKKEFKKNGLRNSQILTIAPAGSISALLGVSSGIEPIFATTYQRKTESLNSAEKYYTVSTPIIKKFMEHHRIKNIELLPDWIKTSQQIDPSRRIAMQAAFQKHIDASISSTINLPEEATVDDVFNIYLNAWEQGLKGITVYREGCKRAGILSTKQDEPLHGNKVNDRYNFIVPIMRNELGERLPGAVYIKEVACGKIYITISHTHKGDLVEVFVDGAKSGGCSTNTEAVGRLASMALRGGVCVDSVIDSIKGLKCAACQNVKGSKVKHIDGLSCPDVIARTIESEYRLQKIIDENNGSDSHGYVDIKIDTESLHNNDNNCPECGEKLKHEGGCVICQSCSWSRCN